MKDVKRYIIGFAGAAGLFLIGSVMRSPGSQAKGAYSTPVQVMNTSIVPAIGVDAEKLARIPYQSTSRTTTCTNDELLLPVRSGPGRIPPGRREHFGDFRALQWRHRSCDRSDRRLQVSQHVRLHIDERADLQTEPSCRA